MDTKDGSFYHMSSRVYSVGDEIAGNGKDKVDPRIEKELQARKPASALSRRDAVYLLEHTDFTVCGVVSSGYIYRVKPNSNPERRDFGWIGEMQKALLKLKYPKIPQMQKYPDWGDELLDRCASGYWGGLAMQSPCWEFLAPSCTVVEVVSSALVDPKSTKGGWRRSGSGP